MLNLRPNEIPAAPYHLRLGEKVIDAAPAILMMDSPDVGVWGAAYLTPLRLHWMPANPDNKIFPLPGDIEMSDIREVKVGNWRGGWGLFGLFESHHGVRIITEEHDVVLTELDKEQAQRWATYILEHARHLAPVGATKSRRSFRSIVSQRSMPITAILVLLVAARALSAFGDRFDPGDALLGVVAVVAILLAWMLYITR
jgi:hypothetical protein